MMKICSSCNIEKEVSEFYTTGKGYVKGKCKICTNALTKEKYKQNAEFRDYVKIKSKKWSSNNPERYKEYRREWARDTIAGIYSRITASNIRKVFSNIISKEDFTEWYNNEKKICSYCGIPESADKVKNKQFFKHSTRLTIDCINPQIGYEKGNLALCCYLCNTVKNNIFNYEEMKEIGEKYISKKIQL